MLPRHDAWQEHGLEQCARIYRDGSDFAGKAVCTHGHQTRQHICSPKSASTHVRIHQHTHPSTHACTHPFIQPSMHAPFIHLFIHSSIHLASLYAYVLSPTRNVPSLLSQSCIPTHVLTLDNVLTILMRRPAPTYTTHKRQITSISILSFCCCYCCCYDEA